MTSPDQFPDLEDVRNALLNQADLKTQLKIAKLELEIYQAELCQRKPRDSTVRIVGVDDISKQQLAELMRRIIHIEEELDYVDATVKFNSHRVEIAKAISYRGRI